MEAIVYASRQHSYTLVRAARGGGFVPEPNIRKIQKKENPGHCRLLTGSGFL